MPATKTPTRRDTLNVGRRFTEPYGDQIEREIRGLRWGNEPQTGMLPGLGINAAIRELKLPKVTAYATNGSFTVPDPPETATYGVYGIEANYRDCRIRLYLADTGTEIVPLFVDVFEREG